MTETLVCPFCSEMPDDYDNGMAHWAVCKNKDCPMFDVVMLFDHWQNRPVEDAYIAIIGALQKANDKLEAQLKVAIGYETMWKVRMGEGVYQPFEPKEIE